MYMNIGLSVGPATYIISGGRVHGDGGGCPCDLLQPGRDVICCSRVATLSAATFHPAQAEARSEDPWSRVALKSTYRSDTEGTWSRRDAGTLQHLRYYYFVFMEVE